MTSFIELHEEIIDNNINDNPNQLGAKCLVSVEQIVAIFSNEKRKDGTFKDRFTKSFSDGALSNAGCALKLSTGCTIDVCECEAYIKNTLDELGYSIG